jgi:hypothetical protein
MAFDVFDLQRRQAEIESDAEALDQHRADLQRRLAELDDPDAEALEDVLRQAVAALNVEAETRSKLFALLADTLVEVVRAHRQLRGES